MDGLREVGSPRRRWQLALIALLLVTLVGAVVWERGAGGDRSHPTPAAAPVEPGAIGIAQVKVGTTTFFVKTVQGLVIGAKKPGTGLKFVRGLTSDAFFTNWVKQMRNRGVDAARRNVTITLLDTSLSPVRTVNVTGAVPVTLTLNPIDGTNPVLETLTLSYTDIAPA